MVSKMKNPGEQPEQRKFLDNTTIKEFVSNQGISEGDLGMLEKLSDFPADLIIEELHNLFSLSKEKSGDGLKSRIDQLRGLLSDSQHPSDSYQRYKLQRTQELCEAVLLFSEKYGWEKSYSLVRILEETVPTQSIFQEFGSSQNT